MDAKKIRSVFDNHTEIEGIINVQNELGEFDFCVTYDFSRSKYVIRDYSGNDAGAYDNLSDMKWDERFEGTLENLTYCEACHVLYLGDQWLWTSKIDGSEWMMCEDCHAHHRINEK